MRWSIPARISTLLLVALAVSPFTAPFSTCDIADVPASTTTHDGMVTHAKTAADTSAAAGASIAAPVPAPGGLARRHARLDAPATTVHAILHAVLRL